MGHKVSVNPVSKKRSDTLRARRLAITSLVTLGTVLLFGLASHGSAVVDSVPPVG